MTFIVNPRLPTFEEYRDLCLAVGWGEGINFEVAPESLARSLFGVVVEQEGRAIGMGRVVGDGAMYFYIQDVAIHPDFQRQGVGRLIMRSLMASIEATARGAVFVGLFATPQAIPLYEEFGFTRGDMQGMFRLVVGSNRP